MNPTETMRSIAQPVIDRVLLLGALSLVAVIGIMAALLAGRAIFERLRRR